MIASYIISLLMFFNVQFGTVSNKPTKPGANKPPTEKTVIIVDITP